MADHPEEPDLRTRLTPLQYQVTQCDATEPPFQNTYWNEHRTGIYVDVISGEALFSSQDKYDSGTGWPSFSRPIDPTRITTRADHALGVQRTEIRTVGSDSHLGHLFPDGPGPSGMRYCTNSAALRFIPLEEMVAAGYGEWLALFEADDSGAGGASV